MGQTTRLSPWLVLACAVSSACANKKLFNINDDILAYPQVRQIETLYTAFTRILILYCN
jgi:hypothetical protein